MSEPTVVDKILGFSKKLINIEDRFVRQEADIKKLDEALTKLRADVAALTTAVEVLKESHNTVDERSKRVVAEAVAELRVKYAEVVADLRIKVAEGEMERRFAPRIEPPAARQIAPEAHSTESTSE